MVKRPLSVTMVAFVYLLVGTGGFVAHFQALLARDADAISIESTELVAFLAGMFLLRAHNWARWLALVWIAFHVVLSAFHDLGQFAVHLAFCAVIAWILFRPGAARYFQRAADIA